MKKLFITKLAYVFTAFLCVFAFEARADLVDDLIKKHHLDPKNNPKDQCELSSVLNNWIVGYAVFKSEKNGLLCEESGFCSLNFRIYNFDKQKKDWSVDEYNHVMIFRKNPYKIIGVFGYIVQGFDEENHDFDLYKKVHQGFPYKTYFLSDIRASNDFILAAKQKDKMFIKNFNDGKIRFESSKINSNKDISYFKIRGCYVEDFKIIDSDKKIYQPQNKN